MGIESESEDVRKDMVKRLEEQKVRAAFRNLREAGIKSFAFFIYGYPGETAESMERTTAYALDLDPDFANFYPAVPYPGTDLYEKAKREGLLASEDWSLMEYSYYVLRGNGLDEASVMGAIQRARRKFFLRPKYLARHAGDLVQGALHQAPRRAGSAVEVPVRQPRDARQPPAGGMPPRTRRHGATAPAQAIRPAVVS